MRDLVITEGLTLVASVNPVAAPAAALDEMITGMKNQNNNLNKVLTDSVLAVDKAYREWRQSSPNFQLKSRSENPFGRD